MPASPRPLSHADLSRVRAVFTDVDGTLTTRGVLESATIRAMEQLREAGVPVVLVSGRPSGWGECWARTFPVAGVIVENGGLYYARTATGVRKVFVQPDRERLRARARLQREVASVLRKVPGTQLSHDSPAREVDLAIDYNEHVRLGVHTALRLEELMRARKVNAVRSSVHVNFWVGDFDKLSTVRTFCSRVLHLSLDRHPEAIAYAGDSYNDAPMFGGIPLGVGVANVREALDTIDAAPAFITRAAEGAGFRELARAVLRAR